MNKLEKTCLSIATALWLTVAIMTYANIWVTDTQTVTNTEVEWLFDWEHGGYDAYFKNVTSTFDAFPHDKITTTTYVTLIPALFFTLTPLFASIDYSDKQKEEE